MACINEGDTKHAPRYSIPPRRLGALEHPLIVEDVDRGIRTFGSNPALQAVRQALAHHKLYRGY
jgi:general transcription factor 3C polypeptide 5 (transcription factor C subunit 1)